MRNAVRKIDGAINRVHDPAVVSIGVSSSAFFAQECNGRKCCVQPAFDDFLATDVEFEFDVELSDGMRTLGIRKLLAHQRSDRSCGFNCDALGSF